MVLAATDINGLTRLIMSRLNPLAAGGLFGKYIK